MKFWAIAYKYQEDVFYDFAKMDDGIGLEPTCLLPTESLAKIYVEDELGSDYVAVEVDIYKVELNGSWSYSFDTVEEWEEF
jgi:hypothetical protein